MNFRGLSNKQAEVLGQMCVGQEDGHNPRTLKALEAKGLLVGYDEIVTEGGISVKTLRYFVPTPVHIEWCEWCAANVGDETY